ncbi:MAG: ABC transporter substrate-binding protein [Candidatus Protistobacter heckmanni]|nr:ABC transporter substrate-binding protein [Candidatus Protistobacter heckmanni]
MRKLSNILTAFGLAAAVGLGAGAAVAQDAAIAATPDGLVKAVVTDVMNTVKGDKEMQSGNIAKIQGLVEKKILPYADFDRTTKLALGRNVSKTSPQQLAQIGEQFKLLLIRTYAGAISQVRDQTVDFKPLRAAAGDAEMVVCTVVMNKGEPIQIDYRLEKTDAGWRVYDLNVLGAWLSEAYRGQFADAINKSGPDGLVQFLKDRNQQLASAKK